jgi:hypothetical protein
MAMLLQYIKLKAKSLKPKTFVWRFVLFASS